MGSVVPERTPFSMPNSYQSISQPSAWGGVGGIPDPGISAGPSEIGMPNIIKDGNNNSNRTIPYTRIVGVQNETLLKQIQDLRGGSLAFIGKPDFRRGGNKVSTSGIDSISLLASAKHVDKHFEKWKPDAADEIPLAVDVPFPLGGQPADYLDYTPPKVKGQGSKLPNGEPSKGMFENQTAFNRYDQQSIYRPGAHQTNGSCFLYPETNTDYLINANDILLGGYTKRKKNASTANTNPKVPSAASNFVLGELYKKLAAIEPNPFSAWTPDGMVIYKYETSDSSVSTSNPSALDTQLDMKQGAMFNIAVAGPALSTDWITQSDPSLSKRCLCLPRNCLYLLIVGTIINHKITKMRMLRTTSSDLAQHANKEDWMGFNKGELILGGWNIGSIIDNAAAPIRQHNGPMLTAPDMNSSLMGLRVVVNIRFVTAFELHQKFWGTDGDGERPARATRLRGNEKRPFGSD